MPTTSSFNVCQSDVILSGGCINQFVWMLNRPTHYSCVVIGSRNSKKIGGGLFPSAADQCQSGQLRSDICLPQNLEFVKQIRIIFQLDQVCIPFQPPNHPEPPRTEHKLPKLMNSSSQARGKVCAESLTIPLQLWTNIYKKSILRREMLLLRIISCILGQQFKVRFSQQRTRHLGILSKSTKGNAVIWIYYDTSTDGRDPFENLVVSGSTPGARDTVKAVSRISILIWR